LRVVSHGVSLSVWERRDAVGVERARRYPSDLTDEQWEIVEPMLPVIKSPRRIPKHPRRAIVDAILYVVRSGCPSASWTSSVSRSVSPKAVSRSRPPGSSILHQ
jgi:transposase